MKIERQDKSPIIVGKRVTIGAAIMSTATAIASFYPEHAVAINALAIPVTLLIQTIVVNRYGVTQ